MRGQDGLATAGKMPALQNLMVREAFPHASVSFFCISSSETPLVSGYTNSTTTNCSTIMAAKNTKGMGFDFAASTGKIPEINAFMIQCVELPRLCPLARTRLGNTSLIYTQITAPCENAKNAM